MMPRYYIKFLCGAAKVDDLVGLAPSNHGTTNPLAPPAGQYGSCPACTEQVAGSAFLRHLNAGDETPGLVSYTQVETSHDEVVTPYSSAFLAPGPRTTNVLLQDRCPLDLTEHLGIIYDPVALQWAENALGRPGPADPRFKPTCASLLIPQDARALLRVEHVESHERRAARGRRGRARAQRPSQRFGFSTIIVWSCSSVIPASRRAGITWSKTSVMLQSFAAPAASSCSSISTGYQSSVAQ
jgi:hypothetical protein